MVNVLSFFVNDYVENRVQITAVIMIIDKRNKNDDNDDDDERDNDLIS